MRFARGDVRHAGASLEIWIGSVVVVIPGETAVSFLEIIGPIVLTIAVYEGSDHEPGAERQKNRNC